jgi:hypothetical protein
VCRVFKYLVHDAEHLEGEQILSEVVAALEDDVDGLAQRVGVGEDDPQGRLRRVHRPTLFHQNTVGHHPIAQSSLVGCNNALMRVSFVKRAAYVGSSGREKLLGRVTLASSSWSTARRRASGTSFVLSATLLSFLMTSICFNKSALHPQRARL